jgi:hypothetical protein
MFCYKGNELNKKNLSWVLGPFPLQGCEQTETIVDSRSDFPFPLRSSFSLPPDSSLTSKSRRIVSNSWQVLVFLTAALVEGCAPTETVDMDSEKPCSNGEPNKEHKNSTQFFYKLKKLDTDTHEKFIFLDYNIFILPAVFRIRIHWIRIRIQTFCWFRLQADGGKIRIRIQIQTKVFKNKTNNFRSKPKSS